MTTNNGKQQTLELADFLPYGGSLHGRKWLDEEDNILDEMAKQANEQGLDMPAVFVAISDKLSKLPVNIERGIERTAKAVDVRYHSRQRKNKGTKGSGYVRVADRVASDDDSLDSLLGKLKSTIKDSKQNNNWRQKYEDLKSDYDKLVKDHDKLINTVKRLIDEDE